jgi:dTDP-4-dehydrorhamnose 3,5-epimerase-like enzyme
MKVKNSVLIELPRIPDGIDGTLSVAEYGKNIPFQIKRVYYIYDLENSSATRGKHAHKELEQVIFCLNGSFILRLDDGENKEEILMNRRNVGVFLGKGLWHTMSDFSANCILLIIASDNYEESDYLRNYEDFLSYIRSKP